MTNQSSIKSKATAGMAWVGISRLSMQVAQFVITVVLARRLMPEDYGTVAMLAIFIAIAQTFLDSGFASALIQKKDRTDTDYSTAFYFNIAVALLLYLIFFITAPWIAEFYSMPILSSVTRVVTLSLIINGLTIVQTARLTINLNFRLQAVADISSTLIAGFIAILLAYNGFGVWSLVFQGVCASSIRAAILWTFSRWKPLLTFSYRSFRQLFSFGSKLLCSGMINTIYNNIYTLVIGRVFNASEVGYYNRGEHFANLPANTVQEMVVKVNYPILSSLQDNNEKLVSAYQKLLVAPMFILYPVLWLMIALAGPMVEVLIGQKWLPSVPILQIICVGAMFNPLTHINLNLLYVKGRSDLVLKLELIKKPIAFMILIASIPFGLIWMCVGRAFYCFLAFVFNCYYTNKLLQYGFVSQMKVLLPIIVRSILMGCIVYIANMYLENVWTKLLIGGFVGILFYTFLSIMAKDKSYMELKEMVMMRIKKTF